jgi:hypothetical protein
MLLDEISSFAKARGTLKNETPALMDISLLKMPDLCFLFFFLMMLSGVSYGYHRKKSIFCLMIYIG